MQQRYVPGAASWRVAIRPRARHQERCAHVTLHENVGYSCGDSPSLRETRCNKLLFTWSGPTVENTSGLPAHECTGAHDGVQFVEDLHVARHAEGIAEPLDHHS